MNKAHIEHSVSFVEYQYAQLIEFNRILRVQVEQAARCGCQNVTSSAQHFHLWVSRNAAKHHA